MGDGGDRLNSLQAAQTQFRLAAKLHFPGRASERRERVEGLARSGWDAIPEATSPLLLLLPSL